MAALTFAPPFVATQARQLLPPSPPRVALGARARTALRHRREARVTCVETPPKPSQTEDGVTATSAPGEDGPSAAAARGEPSARESLAGDVAATLAWVGVAAATAAGVAATRGGERGLEFVTAYIVEYSLSVDNLFVFLLIFKFFRVGRAAQHRVLGLGIAGAMVMRGAMIVLGEALTQRFEAVSVGFAALLLYSAGKLLLEGDGEGEEDLERNSIVRFSRSLLPFTDRYDGDRFFTMQDGMRLATPLMLVLLSVEFSDVVFALDSVPAVLGISDDAVVIYVSNILAIMGLRNLFFVLSDAIGELRFLRQALAVVLGFVGAKMLAGVGGVRVDVLPSLGVVVGTLAAGIGFSVAFPEAEGEAKAE